MSAKKPIAILAALLLASCASSTMSPRSDEERQADQVNATADPSAITGKQFLLAVEVELTASAEVRALDASIVFAPRPPNSASPDLRVRANGIEGWEYAIADPLIATVEDPENPQTIVLQSARTHVFAPLSPALASITIEPAEQSEAVARGGTFDVRELAVRACAAMRSSLAPCREIESRGNVR